MKKEEILNYINEVTQKLEFHPEEYEIFTAKYISEKFNLSRNTISQYLNEFVQKEKLIKVQTRPVYFFHKKSLEHKYNIWLESKVYESLEELKQNFIKQEKKLVNFEKAIGFQESLHYAIEQLKAAVNYPADGLPVLLNGPSGSGKSFLAQLMYEYAIDNNIIEKESPFIVLNCAEFADNPELLTSNLFGHVKGAFTGADSNKIGLIEKANGGFLFLDEVHCLSAKGQEKLFLFMDKGKYRRFGDNSKWYNSNVRFIFATTENLEKVLLKTFLRRIPITVQIPSLKERSQQERKQMIYSFLLEESKLIKKNIAISNQAFNIMLSVGFTGNVGELKNCVKHTCANAYMHQEKDCDVLSIHMNHLPNELFSSIYSQNLEFNSFRNEQEIIIINQKKSIQFDKTRCDRLRELYKKIIICFNNFDQEKIDLTIFVNKSLGYIDEYYDYLIFRNKDKSLNAKFEIINHVLNNIFNMLENKYGIQIYNNMIIALSEYILEYDNIRFYLNIENYFKRKDITRIVNFLQINFQKEYMITMELVDLIKKNIDVEFDTVDLIIFILNIKSVTKNINVNKTLGVVLSHGYSTASSIADATNKLIGQYVFEAIDMPLDVSTETILFRLKRYLNRMHTFKEVILLVDMGSLEDIYKGLEIFEDRTIGIINNITTKLALDIGFQIIQEESIENILNKASKNIYSSYKIIYPKDKNNTILTVCATGIGTAEKFSELLKTSIPSKVDLQIIAYDYKKLLDKDKKQELFDKYNIELIIGTINPNMEGISFVGIEDIISGKGIEQLKQVLIKYLSEEELEMLNKNIVKNFSLQNVLNHLTILNADKILDYIEEALNKLQVILEKRLNNKSIIGLYIHLSCLIERLIMKNPIKTYSDIDNFKIKHKTFIEKVKDSFSVIEKVYSVEIPETEIGYIYDIISNECDI
ncbi:sigma 54-interacting transcriptional regulator [Haloimpatiens sp. FM7330]|uniref:sigma 54-interacting transcriptional regulator n=1 Tax=Haloimpatiens sp. FM7330 TaxID=3298610 RepID=UPI0036316D85